MTLGGTGSDWNMAGTVFGFLEFALTFSWPKFRKSKIALYEIEVIKA